MRRESPLEEPAEVYSPFNPEDVKRLRTYAEDVETLVSLSFFKGPRLSVTIAEPGVGDTFEGPSDEATRAVAGLFRSLYNDHERTSYISILKLLGQHVQEQESPRRSQAIEELRNLRKLKARALKAGSLTITPSGRELTPEVLIDVFLHGRYLHKDHNKLSLLEDLDGDVFLMFEFMGSVQRLSRVFIIGRAVVQLILESPELLPAFEDRPSA